METVARPAGQPQATGVHQVGVTFLRAVVTRERGDPARPCRRRRRLHGLKRAGRRGHYTGCRGNEAETVEVLIKLRHVIWLLCEGREPCHVRGHRMYIVHT